MKRAAFSLAAILAFAASASQAETVCPSQLISDHLDQQFIFFQDGSTETLANFANSLSNVETNIEGSTPADDFFCYSVFDRLSLGTFMLSSILLEPNTVEEKLNALSFLAESRKNYQILLRDFVARNDGGDQIAITLQQLIDKINIRATAFINSHSTTEILAFDRNHGDKSIYRVVFGIQDDIRILEVSFDPELLVTTFDVPKVRSFWSSEDSIQLGGISIRERWTEWASTQGIDIEFGAAEDTIHFADGGYELPLNWRSQSSNHDGRRAAITALQEAFFQFIEPVRREPFEEVPEDDQELEDSNQATQGIERAVPTQTLFAGDCIQYLGDEGGIVLYSAPDTLASYSILGNSAQRTVFSLTEDGSLTPAAQAGTDMSIAFGGVVLFQNQVATSWIEVEVMAGDNPTGFLVYTKKETPTAQAEILFKRVGCED